MRSKISSQTSRLLTAPRPHPPACIVKIGGCGCFGWHGMGVPSMRQAVDIHPGAAAGGDPAGVETIGSGPDRPPSTAKQHQQQMLFHPVYMRTVRSRLANPLIANVSSVNKTVHTKGLVRLVEVVSALMLSIACMLAIASASAAAVAAVKSNSAQKIAIVRSLADGSHARNSQAKGEMLAITDQQARECFTVRITGRYAGIIPRGNYQSLCGQIDATEPHTGLVPWQPSNGISERVAGRWRLLLEFDQAEPLQLHRIGVPVSVYDALFPKNPLGPQDSGLTVEWSAHRLRRP